MSNCIPFFDGCYTFEWHSRVVDMASTTTGTWKKAKQTYLRLLFIQIEAPRNRLLGKILFFFAGQRL